VNVLSLCDGISGGQLALQRAGIKVDKYFASEIDENCIKITQKNFPNTIQIGNILDVGYDGGFLIWKDGKEKVKIHLVMAGTPCQDFSSFKLNAKGLSGKKSSLFYNFSKILWEVEPEWFLFENVKMKKEWRDIISKELNVVPIEIDSLYFSAQKRERLYWTNIPIEKWDDKGIKLSDILYDLPFRDIPKCFFMNWGDKKRIDKGLKDRKSVV
jgi:DNA (cytosine-5)-methyltransferase 3A